MTIKINVKTIHLSDYYGENPTDCPDKALVFELRRLLKNPTDRLVSVESLEEDLFYRIIWENDPQQDLLLTMSERDTRLSSGDTLAYTVAEMTHTLNNRDFDYVYSDLLKLEPEEQWVLFLALIDSYVPWQQDKEYEKNCLQAFFFAILTGSDQRIEAVRNDQYYRSH